MLPASTTNQNITQNDTRPASPSLMNLRALIPLSTYWCSEQDKRGRRVARFRRYYDGDHDANLTKEMANLLRIKDPDDGFTVNMMPTVVDTMMDRAIVQGFDGTEGDNAAGKSDSTTPVDGQPASVSTKPAVNKPTAWAQALAEANKFDTLQTDVHVATGRDGDGYVMVSWNNDKQCVEWTYEPAWDGQSGVIMVYKSRNIKEPMAAIKLWQIEASGAPLPIDNQATDIVPNSADKTDENSNTIMTRVNIYYPDRVEKYYTLGTGSYLPYNQEGDYKQEWTMRDGTPIGIPIEHFRDGGRDNYGVSELRNAMSPQNAMNRFNYSAVMAAELTAFSIYIANGFEAQSQITPGMIVQMAKSLLGADQKDPTFTKLAGSDIKPILEMIDAQRRLISEITRTPSPDLAAGSGGNKSGEYLKQLEVGLIGKVKRFTTRAGQSWEHVLELSARVQSAYGVEQPPAYKRFFTRWKDPQVRNSTEIVQNAVLMDPIWGHRQTLRAVSTEYDNLDEETIDKLLLENQADIARAQAMQAPVDSVNPGSGKVSITEAPETIGGAQQPASQTETPPAKPAVTGNKLPSDQATNADHLTQEHLADLFDQYHATKKAAVA